MRVARGGCPGLKPLRLPRTHFCGNWGGGSIAEQVNVQIFSFTGVARGCFGVNAPPLAVRPNPSVLRALRFGRLATAHPRSQRPA